MRVLTRMMHGDGRVCWTEKKGSIACACVGGGDIARRRRRGGVRISLAQDMGGRVGRV